MGLTWLFGRYREAESNSVPIPVEALAFDKVQGLEKAEVRGLALELLASFPGGPAAVFDFLDRRDVTRMGQYPEEAEEEADRVRHRLRTLR